MAFNWIRYAESSCSLPINYIVGRQAHLAFITGSVCVTLDLWVRGSSPASMAGTALSCWTIFERPRARRRMRTHKGYLKGSSSDGEMMPEAIFSEASKNQFSIIEIIVVIIFWHLSDYISDRLGISARKLDLLTRSSHRPISVSRPSVLRCSLIVLLLDEACCIERNKW